MIDDANIARHLVLFGFTLLAVEDSDLASCLLVRQHISKDLPQGQHLLHLIHDLVLFDDESRERPRYGDVGLHGELSPIEVHVANDLHGVPHAVHLQKGLDRPLLVNLADCGDFLADVRVILLDLEVVRLAEPSGQLIDH